ncbi:hypothetical protein IWQ60_010965 [Tieghemiomyces parasiticus]|uniref:Enoyl reductase (ER) domain-containing protein n=1 Tax=Tieghemiomyces parasiticus TaxID=78921 RepID=A0A9W7ZP34_9FUNG|nr:hypothetical protein IWQ60_010965 [Tieghemiomyces parasiticus]
MSTKTVSKPTASDQVKCLAAKGKGESVVEWEYTARPLGPHDIELTIDNCGICGSDCNQIDTGFLVSEFPFVPGHEIIGRVAQMGEKVKGFLEGQRVAVGPNCYSCEKGDSQCGACRNGQDAYCEKTVVTSGGMYKDGTIARGGYAKSVRVHNNHVLHVPDDLESKFAAPLACGGLTVFAPMLNYKVKAGDRVGIVGIGGLGHMAIMFAKALGAEVTAFTTKEDKRKECQNLGAHRVVNLKDAKQVSEADRSIDFLLVASNSPHIDWDQLAGFMALHSKIVLIGVPSSPIKIGAANLLVKDITLTGSLTGNVEQAQKTLDFAAKHGIKPVIEELPMSKANDGLQRVKDGSVRFRVVLHN